MRSSRPVVGLLALTAVLPAMMMLAAEAGVNSGTTSVPGFQNVTAVEVDPADSRIVYVVSGPQRFSRSTDGGEHWYHFDSATTRLNTLSTVPGRPGFLYIAGAAPYRSESNVYLSTDYGTTWEPRGLSLSGESKCLQVDPRQPDVVYLGTTSGLHKTTDGGLTWQSLLGSPGVFCLAVDRFDSRLLYAGTKWSPSLWRSTDGGMTWTTGLAGFPRKVCVDSVATDPITPDTVYAGTAGGGIYRSTDGGTSWKSLPAPVANAHLQSIVPHAALSGGMYVLSQGTESAGLYRTPDGGASWERREFPAPATSGLGVDPGDPSNIYLGTAEGLLRTTDAGDSWKLIGSGLEVTQTHTGGSPSAEEDLHAWTASQFGTFLPEKSSHDASSPTQIVDPAQAVIKPAAPLQAGCPRSQGAEAWLQAAATTAVPPVGWTNFGPYSGAAGQAVVDPFNPGTVYFGPASASDLDYGEDGVHLRSTDGGQSWKTWTTGRWWSLSFGASPGLVFRASPSGVWKSTDSGETWSQCASLPAVGRVIPDPADPKVVWALETDYPGLGSGSILKSTDGGGTWRTVRSGGGMSRMAIDPKRTSKVYVGGRSRNTGAAATVRSMDGGATWSVCGIRAPEDLLVDPERPGYVYFADARFGILKSTDDGWTWTPANEGLPRPEAHRLAYDPIAQVLYCGVSASVKGTVYKSTDAAASWQPTDPSLKDKISSLVVVGPRHLVAGSVRGGYWTTDAGATWHKSEDEVSLAGVRYVSVTPADPDLIYAATSAGLFRSDDAGSQWVSINPELDPEEMAWSIAAAPTDDSQLLAAANSAVFLSRDRGDHWEQVFQIQMSGRYGRRAIHLALAPDDPSTFYVTVVDTSLWLSTDADAAMFRTRDAGKTWTTLAINPFAFTGEPVIGPQGRLCILQNGDVWRSDDHGDSWTKTFELWKPWGGVWQIAGAPSNPSVLYAFENEQKIVRQSRDSGETWTKVAQLEFLPGDLWSMVVDPLDSDRAYLSADQVYLLTASLGSVRPLGFEGLNPWNLAVVSGYRVLLALGSYPGLCATQIPPTSDRLPPRQSRKDSRTEPRTLPAHSSKPWTQPGCTGRESLMRRF